MVLPLCCATAKVLASDVQIDGFASFVGGRVVSGADTPGSIRNPGTILGYDRDLSFKPDSLFAVQMYSDLKDGLSATGQLVARSNDDWKPELVWGFLSYQFDSNLRIKAGRSRIPFFLFSDSIDVGYSYPWVSPPPDLYILSGIDNIDGLNLEFTQDLAGWAARLNLVGGNSDTTLTIADNETDVTSDRIVDLTLSLNKDWFTLQLTAAQCDATVDAYSALLGAYDLLNIDLTERDINLLTLNEDKTRFMGAGVYIDNHPWLWISEYTTISIDDAPMQADRTAWYTSVGYRWKRLTPHLTYLRSLSPVEDHTRALVNDKIMSRINQLPSGNPQVVQLIESTEFAYLTDEDLTAMGVGVRYDFHSSAAVKAEFQRRSNHIAGTRPELLLVGVDLVF